MVTTPTGQYAATVKGGMFAQFSATLNGQSTGGELRRRAAFALSRKGARGFRAIMAAVNGIVVGGAASKTNGRIANSEELGGKRTIENETLISGTTAAADTTAITNDILNYSSTIGNSPPANLDGNPLGTR